MTSYVVHSLMLYILIYGGMHAYFARLPLRAFPDNRRVKYGVIAFVAFMMLAPILSVLLKRTEAFWLHVFVSVFAFTWAVWLFWFCSIQAALDLWNLLTWLRYRRRSPANSPPRIITPRKRLLVIICLIFVGTIWGIVEARTLQVRKITVPCAQMPADSATIRIALVSDLHIGPVVRAEWLEEVVQTISAFQPDVILSAGDLIDSPLDHIQEEAAILNNLSAPMGKYAVTGNHEFYAGIDQAMEFHEAAGFHLLRGEAVDLGHGRLTLVGVDDPAAQGMNGGNRIDETLFLPARSKSRPPTILLKHQPRFADGARGRFDLQLSGHTHGGQVFPFLFFVRMVFRYGAPGTHDLPGDATLFVSRGTGTWGTPLRVLAPPEVTLINLKPATTSRHQKINP